MRTLGAIVLGLSLAACSAPGAEEEQLPDELGDGKTDSMTSPTSFGPLFSGVWQYGALDPRQKVKNAAFDFELAGDAEVTVTTRQAPSDDPELTDTSLYIYGLGRDGKWHKQLRATDGGEGDFAQGTVSLPKGRYRAIVKGATTTASGEFMIQLHCLGAGCPAEEPCLFGDSLATLHEQEWGAVTFDRESDLTAATRVGTGTAAQLMRLAEDAGLDVTDPAGLFAAVSKVHSMFFSDNLSGLVYRSLSLRSGGKVLGAIFEQDAREPSASLEGDVIGSCQVVPQTCVLGREVGEAEYMPDMQVESSKSYHAASQVTDSALKRQILAAVSDGNEQPTTSLAAAFDQVDSNAIYVDVFSRQAGSRKVTYTQVHFYSGDTSVGTIFEGTSTRVAAVISDGTIEHCAAF